MNPNPEPQTGETLQGGVLWAHRVEDGDLAQDAQLLQRVRRTGAAPRCRTACCNQGTFSIALQLRIVGIITTAVSHCYC